jgi:predicted dehydrogenase
MATPIPIGIVGFGKIARDQHAPSLAASEAFRLVATASPHSSLQGVPAYLTIEQMLTAHPEVSAVALCTTPQVRYQAARHALDSGCHVLLEKPPGASLSEVHELTRLAALKGLTLLASWHSRHANGVEPARTWLASRRIIAVSVNWKEDVRKWHPGQSWIWKAGGLGVFDPGINALSVLTRILPGAVVFREALLSYPSNCETPIAASLVLMAGAGAPIRMELDFRHTGVERWDIEVETDDGTLVLSLGGSVLHIQGRSIDTAQATEYSRLYAHFAGLIREGRSDADVAPMTLVADAFLGGRRIEVAPFLD